MKYFSKRIAFLASVFYFLFLTFCIFAETALVTNEKSGTLSIVNLDTDQIVKTIPLGKVPHSIGVTPDKRYAYIGNRGESSVSVVDLVLIKIDAKKLKYVKSIRVGDWPSIMTILP